MKDAKALLESIQSQDIKPKAKWQFRSLNIGIWISYILFILLGSVAFSVILFAIQQSELKLISHMSHSKLEMVLALLPYVWLILLMLFLVGAVFSIQASWKGYKFSIFRLVWISLLMSILLGTLIFISGGGEVLEKSFAMQVSAYESIHERKMEVWSRPQEGFLSGVIKNFSDDGFQIEDFKGNTWDIFLEDVFVAPAVLLEIDEMIKLKGVMISARSFRAEEIRPWGGRHRQGM